MTVVRVPVSLNVLKDGPFVNYDPIGYADVNVETGEATIQITSPELASWLSDKTLKGLSVSGMAILGRQGS